MSKKLVLITLEFPDRFLEEELPHLLSSFDSVFIVAPRVKPDVDRERLIVHQLESGYRPDRAMALLKMHWLRAFKIYTYSLFSTNDFFYYIRYHRSFLGYLLKELELIAPLKKFILENDLQEALFYDFWLVDATLALAELKKEGLIKKSIARAHGFDLYDERQFERRVSFRNYRIKYLDKVYVVSKHGAAYLKERVKGKFAQKIEVGYLGVSGQPSLPAVGAKPTGYFTIVSCARMIPLKRIHLIVDILKSIQLPILWVHFGDGPEMDRVSLDAGGFPSHVKCELRGNVGNAEVLEFYRTNHVDLFVSVSESEGLPVSMMEAISFGIPIFACCVGAVNEIVNSETGVLCSPHDTVDEMGAILVNALTKRKFDRARIVDFYKGHFNAEKNYRSFIEVLQKIG